uniref:Arf-GAP with coiled-coil, ANK repeat and PH domain-containing protein 2 n=1 Tax=Angiostrongylus costaricensis TaxID=334426 RepID=A0A158PIN3_ANGCS
LFAWTGNIPNDCSERFHYPRDSPRFRASLAHHMLYFSRLESRLNEIQKHVANMMEYSKNYVATFYKLTVSINQLCDESFTGNVLAQSTLHSLSDACGRIVSLAKDFHEQSCMLLFPSILIFSDLVRVQEARAHFDSMSTSMDEALSRNAASTRTRPSDAVEGRNALTAVGACFAHTTLDYVAQINIVHALKDHLIIDALWSFIRESSSYFSRGHAVFDEWTAVDNGAVADSIAALTAKSRLVQRKMQDIHSLVPKEMFQHFSGMSPDPDVMMEGYLYKRSSNAFKTWNRRWFQIKDNKLLYSHRSAESEQPTVMEENLMLCLVRPAPPSVERVGCFELITPTRSHLLQADSESLCNDWMRALQRTILALHESDDVIRPSSSAKPGNNRDVSDVSGSSSADLCSFSVPDATTTFEQIRRVPGNERCADCGSDQPKWVSINLGVVLCIECSGVHRSFGVQISKIRSLTMDSIEPELRDVLLSLGNSQVNAIYLAHLPEKNVVPPPASESSIFQIREAWIKAKYVERRFAISCSERARSSAAIRNEHLARHRISICGLVGSTGDSLLIQLKRLSSCGSDPIESTDWDTISEASRCGDVLGLLQSFASGADINCDLNGTTALHIATKNGQTAAVEFLLLNGAKINVLDDKLCTPLHLAAAEGNTLQVCQLLKRGADKSLKNADGVTPLEIAVERKHADIVTLNFYCSVFYFFLSFNEEFNNPMDDTVDSVISDITRKAAVTASQLQESLQACSGTCVLKL